MRRVQPPRLGRGLLCAPPPPPAGPTTIVAVTSTPQIITGGTPADLNTIPWQVTITFTGANTAPSDRALIVSADDSGGCGFWSGNSGTKFGLYPLGGGGMEWNFTTSLSQPITVTVVPSVSLTIAGATTGNGTFDITSIPAPYFFVGRDLYIGCYPSFGSYELEGTVSDIITA